MENANWKLSFDTWGNLRVDPKVDVCRWSDDKSKAGELKFKWDNTEEARGKRVREGKYTVKGKKTLWPSDEYLLVMIQSTHAITSRFPPPGL